MFSTQFLIYFFPWNRTSPNKFSALFSVSALSVLCASLCEHLLSLEITLTQESGAASTSGADRDYQHWLLLARNTGNCYQLLSDALHLSWVNRSQAHLLTRAESSLKALRAMTLPVQPGWWELSCLLASSRHFALKRSFPLASPWAVSGSDLALQFIRMKWEKVFFCYGKNKLTLMRCTVLVSQGLQRKVVEQMFCFRSFSQKTLADQVLPLFLKPSSCPDFRDLLNEYRWK